MQNLPIIYLDAGHGGIDKEGRYTTAPDKMYQHQTHHQFHSPDGNFYEGVSNRTIADVFEKRMINLGFTVIKVYDEVYDTPLVDRIEKANWYHKNYRPGIFISFHSNAFDSKARGYEIYTSHGHTKSDLLATNIYEETRNQLKGYPSVRFRKDESDGDVDKEAHFYVLRTTIMPAVLIENLFFDNLADALLLMKPRFQNLLAEGAVRGVIQTISLL